MNENRYAIIEDGVVVNIAIAYGAWPHGGHAVDIDENPEVSIGWTYQEGIFVAPPQPDIPEPTFPEPLSTTPLQFIERFTDEEQLAIVTATMSNPVVKLWYDKLLAAQEVVFADPKLQQGLDYLVSVNLITTERRQAVLPEATTSGVTVL